MIQSIIILVRIIYILLLALLSTSMAYSQHRLTITTDEGLEQELKGRDKVFYMIIDSTLYPLEHIVSTVYLVPEHVQTLLSTAKQSYVYFETNDGYYWTHNQKDIFYDITYVFDVHFYAHRKWFRKKTYKYYMQSIMYPLTGGYLSFPKYKIHFGHAAVLTGITNYQKKVAPKKERVVYPILD